MNGKKGGEDIQDRETGQWSCYIAYSPSYSARRRPGWWVEVEIKSIIVVIVTWRNKSTFKAQNVTTTSASAGKFETRFFHMVSLSCDNLRYLCSAWWFEIFPKRFTVRNLVEWKATSVQSTRSIYTHSGNHSQVAQRTGTDRPLHRCHVISDWVIFWLSIEQVHSFA